VDNAKENWWGGSGRRSVAATCGVIEEQHTDAVLVMATVVSGWPEARGQRRDLSSQGGGGGT
jgi:hypothetical protein